MTFGILASRGRPALLLTGAILATLWAAVVTAGFFSQSQMDASELARLAPLRPFQWSMLVFGWAGAFSGYWSFPAARRARRAAREVRGTSSAAEAVGAAAA